MGEAYGVLCSVRRVARATNDLVNAICAKFANEIVWDYALSGWNLFDRPGKKPLFFRARGNKYANWLELMSSDLDMLRQVKGAFPTDFRMEVQTKEGTV